MKNLIKSFRYIKKYYKYIRSVSERLINIMCETNTSIYSAVIAFETRVITWNYIVMIGKLI